MSGIACGDRLEWSGSVCVLPAGHPGYHAKENGTSWGRLRPATWASLPTSNCDIASDLVSALKRYTADDACILEPDAPDWHLFYSDHEGDHLDHCRYCVAMHTLERAAVEGAREERAS